MTFSIIRSQKTPPPGFGKLLHTQRDQGRGKGTAETSFIAPSAGRNFGQGYMSRRPSMAFSMVISSVYSMSLPTGIPIAMRVTLTPARFNCCAR